MRPAVFLNGFPKAGNHALWKAVELLGVPGSVKHVPWSADAVPSGDAPIFIRRDPRNIVVSMLRMRGKPVTPGTFLATFRLFQDRHLVVEMAEYEGWLSDAAVHQIRFEDLIENDKALRTLATRLGVPYQRGAFESLPGMTKTWTGAYSDYRAVWTDYVDECWCEEGGPGLLERWGY